MLVDWINRALAHSNMKQAELARQLTARLRRTIDRAAVNKMAKGGRAIAADEMLAIAEITGFPAPDAEQEAATQEVPLISWVSAGAMQTPDAVEEVESAPRISMTGLGAGDWIALRVQGHSMDRISPPDSIIFVDRRDTRLVSNACYVIVGPDGEATYKRYRGNPARFEPVSVDADLEPVYPDHDPVVIGRVRRTVLDM